jgi:hypothetical protein
VEIVPYVEFPPETPPACQVTAVFEEPFTVAVNCCVWPNCKFTLVGATDTVTPELSVTGTFAEDVPFAWAIHVTVTVLGVENVVGAVYSPVVEIVPVIAFPPTTSSTSQVTFVFASPDSRQVNCSVPPNPKIAVVGVILTVMVSVDLELLLLPPHEMQHRTVSEQTNRKTRLLVEHVATHILRKTKLRDLGLE